MRNIARLLVLGGAVAASLGAGAFSASSPAAAATRTKAIVRLAGSNAIYLRNGVLVWRIANLDTLKLVAAKVSRRERRASLDGLVAAGTVTVADAAAAIGSAGTPLPSAPAAVPTPVTPVTPTPATPQPEPAAPPAPNVNQQPAPASQVSVSIQRLPNPSTASRILPSGAQATPVDTIRLVAHADTLYLERLVLQLSGLPGGSQGLPGFANVQRVHLLNGATEIGQASITNYGTSTGDAVIALPAPLQLAAEQNVDVTVAVDLSNAGLGAEATQFNVALKSASSQDVVVRSQSSGYLAADHLVVAPDLARSDWFLVHEAIPVASTLPVTAHSMGSIDEFARFRLANSSQGSVSFRLENLSFQVSATGLGGADRVTQFRLYDENGSLVATPDAEVTLGGASPSVATVTFSNAGSFNGGWVTNREVGIGSSRTFSLRANTSEIRSSGSGARALQGTLAGQVGRLEGNSSSELNWADGGIAYSYATAGSSNRATGLTASDSYPAAAPAISYN